MTTFGILTLGLGAVMLSVVSYWSPLAMRVVGTIGNIVITVAVVLDVNGVGG